MMICITQTQFIKIDSEFKIHKMITNTHLMDEIIDWAKETKFKCKFYSYPGGGHDINVGFAFNSEQDMGMFTLRWYDLLVLSYQSSSMKQLIDIYSKIKTNYRVDEHEDESGL